MVETRGSTSIGRRAVVRGAAWSVPVVVLATPVPAIAASCTYVVTIVNSLAAGSGTGVDLYIRDTKFSAPPLTTASFIAGLTLPPAFSDAQATPLMAKVLTNIAILKRKSGDYPGAEAAVRESLGILDRLPGDQRLNRLENRTVLDYILALRGNWAAALANGEARLAERMELLGGEDPGLAVDYNNVAVAYARMDRYADARAAYARCADLLSAGGLADSARMAGVERGRAALYARLGKFDEAQAALAKADQLRRRNLPPEHPDQRDTAFGSAVLARLGGDAARSQQRLSELLSTSPEADPRRGDYRYELARSEIVLGHWELALPQLQQLSLIHI